MIVEETQIRGERSVGMLLAEDEMGLTDDHTGIMILPSDLTPGTEVTSALPLEDWALEISITPNRPDCTSVIGIAREIAALTGQRLRKPDIEFEETDAPIVDLADVHIEDIKGCPRYAAGMIRGVELRPSPFWMRYRLFISGVRSINNVVDVSNYVLLEMGQPLHAFDYDRLKENRIVVRRAREGAVFSTLDGQARTLNGEVLMICDGQRSVALAGIMGGLNSEIFEGSKNVLIESAYFDPVTIRRGSKSLGLSTEASYRFERGIDIEGVISALGRSLMLMSELAGGKICRGIIDRYPEPRKAPVIDLHADRTNRFLGTAISLESMAGYLKALEMDVQVVDENMLRVEPPSFRVDLAREVDLMEEVARLEGFDKIPATSPPIRSSDERDAPELSISAQIKEIMVGLGFTEIISYSFISPDSADLLGAEKQSPLRAFVPLLNPLAFEQSVMRTSLLPGLLAAVKNNMAHGEGDLKLFELGKIFFARKDNDLPREEPSLAAMMTGLFNRQAWYREEREVDFFDIKGAVEGLLKALGLHGFTFKRDKASPGYRPEVFASINLSEVPVGHVGQLSPDVLEKSDIKTEHVYGLELKLNAILDRLKTPGQFKPFAKFPAVLRDISLIVGRQIESAGIRQIIEKGGGDLVESVSLFDMYEGEKMDPSEKALTFRVCYRSEKGTLDGKEVNQLHEEIISQIEKKTGGRLREG